MSVITPGRAGVAILLSLTVKNIIMPSKLSKGSLVIGSSP
jgi:hypothetical protein